MQIEIEIGTDELERQIITNAARQILNGFIGEPAQATRDKVDEIMGDHIAEVVVPLIEYELAQPIQRTNSMGEPQGEPRSLRELVVDLIEKQLKIPDAQRHGYREDTILTQFVKRIVQEEITKELRPVLDAAKKQILDAAKAHGGEMLFEFSKKLKA